MDLPDFPAGLALGTAEGFVCIEADFLGTGLGLAFGLVVFRLLAIAPLSLHPGTPSRGSLIVETYKRFRISYLYLKMQASQFVSYY